MRRRGSTARGRGTRSSRWTRVAAAPLALPLLLWAATASCSEEPVGPQAPVLEAIAVSGSDQFGTVDATLPEPLRVLVRVVDTQDPSNGTNVRWEVDSGNATLVGSSTVVTNTEGTAEVRVRLGSTTGQVVVRATVIDQESAFATFDLFTIDPPQVDAVAPTSVVAGDVVTLQGANFSPNADQNVVLFSGIRGVVTSASTGSLQVLVPDCLPTRDVDVHVQLGTVGSGSVALSVTENGTFDDLAVGEVLDVADDAGFTCLRLPGGTTEQYLAIVHSAGTVGGATHPFTLTALSAAPPLLARAPSRFDPRFTATTAGSWNDADASATTAGSWNDADASVPGPRQPGTPTRERQAAWDAHLRAREAQLALERPDGPGALTVLPPAAAPPQQGDRRPFSVYDGQEFHQVMAEARYVGQKVALFVDDDAPSPGFGPSDLQSFAERFDEVIHPTVTDAFGAASDLDGNDVVIVLFTPQVNALTPAGGNGGFVGGFFYGLDLQPGQNGSNGGEIFYALVPDPDGQYSDERSVEDVLTVTPAILAHEFQHMVHYNERFLERNAPNAEALWLSEALAQMAEDRVARAYDALGDAQSAALFRGGNRTRAQRYLESTRDVSLIVGSGQGTLEERGAGFLHLLYLTEQEGEGLLGALTRTTSTGVANVEARTGGSWPLLLAHWWSAVWLDGPGAESGPLVYPVTDLRAFLGAPFPLEPTSVGSADFEQSGALWSSSAAYYILSPGLAGSTSVRLGGEEGSASAATAALRLRIIRIS